MWHNRSCGPGVDAGKAAHYCVAINADGQRVLSRRVVNDEAALTDLIRAVKELADGGSVRWAIDLNSGGAAPERCRRRWTDSPVLYPFSVIRIPAHIRESFGTARPLHR
jgi:hypothetical protein